MTPRSPPDEASAAGPGPAVVIGGMHRSGTSLLASLFEGAGVSIGCRLLGDGNGNEAGHFEDIDFHDFHERALIGNGLPAEGFTSSAEPQIPETLRAEAAALVAARRGAGGLWGWKDPRTTLFLEFWAGMLAEARFVFVFRRPWEVVDSFFRRGDPTFVYNPLLAVRVWLHYNRLILRFVASHPDRCLVRETTQVATAPRRVFAAIRRQFGVPVGEPPERFRPEMLSSDAEGRQAALVAASCPEAIEVYHQLCHEAGSSPTGHDVSRLSTAEIGVIEWARAARMQREAEEVRRDWVRLRVAATPQSDDIRSEGSRAT